MLVLSTFFDSKSDSEFGPTKDLDKIHLDTQSNELASSLNPHFLP